MAPNSSLHFHLHQAWIDPHPPQIRVGSLYCPKGASSDFPPIKRVQQFSWGSHKIKSDNGGGPRNNISSWWFQPIWKYISQIGSFLQVGVKIRLKTWNHHLDILLRHVLIDLLWVWPPPSNSDKYTFFVGIPYWKTWSWWSRWHPGRGGTPKIYMIYCRPNTPFGTLGIPQPQPTPSTPVFYRWIPVLKCRQKAAHRKAGFRQCISNFVGWTWMYQPSSGYTPEIERMDTKPIGSMYGIPTFTIKINHRWILWEIW